MHPIEERSPDAALMKRAAPRHGVFLAAEAAACGITPAGLTGRCQKGTVRRLHRGVYALTAVPPSCRQTLLAVCLWAGAGTAASHRAAAALWDLDGFNGIELEITGPRRLFSDRVRCHVTSPLPASDITQIDGIPTTGIERTLLDLAGVVDIDVLEDALDCALRRRLTSAHRLLMKVRGAGRKKGVAKLRSLLAERDHQGQPSASRFETRLNRLLLKSGLPAARQFTVWDGGEFIARVDFCFPDSRLIVEADSYRWHSSRRAWQRDIERRNRLTSLGWTVINITWQDLIQRPDQTVTRLRELLHPRLALGGH